MKQKFISMGNYSECSYIGKSNHFSLLENPRDFLEIPVSLKHVSNTCVKRRVGLDNYAVWRDSQHLNFATLSQAEIKASQVLFPFPLFIRTSLVSLVHVSLLSRLVCTIIKTPQSFSMNFCLNLNFLWNISVEHDKGYRDPPQKIKSPPSKKTRTKQTLCLLKNDFKVVKIVFSLA